MRDELRLWAIQAFDLLARRMQGRELPHQVRLGFKVEKHPPGSTVGSGNALFTPAPGVVAYTTAETRTEVQSIDWLVDKEYWAELRALPAYAVAIKALRGPPPVASQLDLEVGTRLQTHMMRDVNLLMRLLKNMWTYSRSLAFDEQTFAHTYASLERFLSSDTLRTRILVPLDGAAIDSGSCVLSDCTRLITLSEEMQQDLYAGAMSFRELYGERLTDLPRTAIVIERQERKLVGQRSYDWEYVQQQIDQAVSVLRIFKAGFFAYQMIQVCSGPEEWGLFPCYSYERKRYPPYPNYRLTGQEYVGLRKLYEAYLGVSWQDQRALGLAIRRLNLGAERRQAEDRLIDYCICLEALCSKKEEGTEIGFRLAVRCARLLGNDLANRKQIFREVKRAYACRSDVVHGKSHIRPRPLEDGKEMTLEDVTGQLERHVRHILAQLIEAARTGTKDPPIDWDDKVLE